MAGKDQVIRHIVEKSHDEWKFSIASTIGPTDNRHEIKVRGDDIESVMKEYEEIKKKLTGDAA